jgi:acyl-coenzyme A synthetase/AMP-(fatty) acid ligase
VEACLSRHPAIRSAGVIGVPSQFSGEAIWAYVQPQPGVQIDSGEVLSFCRGRIAPFKVPEVVRFVERLPVSATGKVRKFILRERAARELAEKEDAGDDR